MLGVGIPSLFLRHFFTYEEGFCSFFLSAGGVPKVIELKLVC